MPRVVDLASSALAVPSSGWQDAEAYPELAQKAGMLAARLAKNHPLPDGNKRAAWLSLIEFVERNGYRLEQPEPGEAV
jgi:death-on-curing protein